jgi:anaerobic magnesium-protoporphyrin IX monomethyl ester cyclase
MIDCLIVGFNDSDFSSHVETVRLMGESSGTFQDLRLAYIDHDGRPRRGMEALTLFHNEDREGEFIRFHNADFLWPVVSYLGTYLDRHGFSFDYVNLFHLEKEKLREKLLTGQVRSVAITTTLYVTAQPIVEIVEFVRQIDPKVTIIIGGPHIANQAKLLAGPDLELVFRYMNGDIYVISSEGEHTLTLVLDALKTGKPLAEVPNLAYRDENGFNLTLPKVESNSLPDNPTDYRLFDNGSISEFVTTRTAKSCPFSCAFCGFPQQAGKYTYLDLKHVEMELDRLREMPQVSTITFIDDTFNVPKVRFREILQLMIDKDYGFKWNSFYRSDHGDDRTIRMMRDAGCEGTFLGIESGSDEMLKRMNKTSRRKDYLAAIKTFNECGISTYASLIIGFPGETEATVAETISLLEEAQPDYFRSQLWYADPGTPIWQDRDKYGLKGSGFSWVHDTMSAATACEVINHIFLTVKGSTWMPHWGFEHWSTFYLQRRGMPEKQVKRFVHAFNKTVADQMLNPGKKYVEPHLLAELREASRFEVVLPRGRAA